MTAPDDLISRADALAAMRKHGDVARKFMARAHDEQNAESHGVWSGIVSYVDLCGDAIRALAAHPLTPTPVDDSPAPQANGNALAEALKLQEVVDAAKLCSEWDEWALQVGGVCPDRLVNCMGKLRAALKAVE